MGGRARQGFPITLVVCPDFSTIGLNLLAGSASAQRRWIIRMLVIHCERTDTTRHSNSNWTPQCHPPHETQQSYRTPCCSVLSASTDVTPNRGGAGRCNKHTRSRVPWHLVAPLVILLAPLVRHLSFKKDQGLPASAGFGKFCTSLVFRPRIIPPPSGGGKKSRF